jgi:hypothetical protein
MARGKSPSARWDDRTLSMQNQIQSFLIFRLMHIWRCYGILSRGYFAFSFLRASMPAVLFGLSAIDFS